MRVRFGSPPMSKAILYDATIGIDCKLCEKACAERNHLPDNDKIAAGFTIFALAVKYLPIFPEGAKRRDAPPAAPSAVGEEQLGVAGL